MGGAIYCAVGSGVYPDFDATVQKMSHVVKTFQPDPAQVSIYNQKYQVYYSLLQALDGKWSPLHNLQEELNNEDDS